MSGGLLQPFIMWSDRSPNHQEAKCGWPRRGSASAEPCEDNSGLSSAARTSG